MRVLITGGCGFIGSFAAERFYKEGYKVYIIDNLSTGNRSNVTVPHTFYEIDILDRHCEEIFKSGAFDVVIHLAAQTDVSRSITEPTVDTQANISGLVHMLELSAKYKVRQFIFASSAAVYGHNEQLPLTENSKCNPESIYGMNKLQGEYYCKKWTEMYGLKTICFRFANVYGPRQNNMLEGGVISIFMNLLQKGEELKVYGDGKQTRDFIYVEDVVDAMYRATKTDVSGSYNLSTQTETSINQLIEKLKSFYKSCKVSYLPERKGDIRHSCLSYAKATKELDWVPIYSLEEGLQKTKKWFEEQSFVPVEYTKGKMEKKNKSNAKQRRFKFFPYLENLIAFLLLTLLISFDFEIINNTYIDFRIIYIIIFAVLYGTKQSLISVFLSVGLYFAEHLQSGRDFLSLLYDSDTLFHIALYLFFGLVVGYSTDKRKQDSERKSKQIEQEQEKYAFLKKVYEDTRIVKDELQSQIIHSEESLGSIYSIIQDLETLETNQVLHTSIEVLEKIMKSDQISIYSVNSNKHYLRLMSKSGDENLKIARSLKILDYDYLTQVVQQKTLWINKELIPDAPMYVAPITYADEVIALIFIHRMPFEHFTLYRENLLAVTANLISGALSRAIRFEEATIAERYLEGTPILKPEHFNALIRTRENARRKQLSEYIILEIKHPKQQWNEISHKLMNVLREQDSIGTAKDGKLYILLSNTTVENIHPVIHRLQKSGIVAHHVSEERAYA